MIIEYPGQFADAQMFSSSAEAARGYLPDTVAKSSALRSVPTSAPDCRRRPNRAIQLNQPSGEPVSAFRVLTET